MKDFVYMLCVLDVTFGQVHRWYMVSMSERLDGHAFCDVTYSERKAFRDCHEVLMNSLIDI